MPATVETGKKKRSVCTKRQLVTIKKILILKIIYKYTKTLQQFTSIFTENKNKITKVIKRPSF